MGPWTAWMMADQKQADLRAESSRSGRHSAPPGRAAGRRAQRSTQGYQRSTQGYQRSTQRCQRSVQRWQRVSEWAGYKMIGIGCRLARPAVVARVQAEL
jgi:hypothetical protein